MNIHEYVHDKTLQLKKSNSRLFLTGILAEKGWTFVAVSYSTTSAEAQLWIDGNMVNSTRLGTKVIWQDSQSLLLGGKGFKGKITQLMLFNLTLTQEQIQGIKRRISLPGETKSPSSLKRKMILFSCFKTYHSLN